MSYAIKLGCLSLAAFAIVHLACALAVNAAAPAALRSAQRMRAAAAARFLLILRLTPAAVSIFVVAALCIPSYLSFEPEAASEAIGPVCLALAFLAVALAATSLARVIAAAVRSRRWLRGPAQPNAVAVAGIIRPRVIVGDSVARELSHAELDAALRHERAHADSHDNLKRVLVLAAPHTFPFFPARFTALELAWKKFSEWAADDRAVSADPDRAVALASALLHIARLGEPATAPLITSLTDGNLAERIERLLTPPIDQNSDRVTPALIASAALALIAALLSPGALASVYDLLERLIQ